MTASQKAEACALWAAGEMTLVDLSKKFKKNPSTLKNLFEREGITKGQNAKAIQEQVAKAVAENMVDDAAVIAQRARETKEQHYKMAAGLSNLTWMTIMKAREENRPMGSLTNDMKALKSAAEILRITREERYAVLGLNEKVTDDDSELPDLIVQELTAAEIKDMHAAQAAQIDPDGAFDMEAEPFGDEDLLGELDGAEDDLLEAELG
jgi:hypothetical protein